MKDVIHGKIPAEVRTRGEALLGTRSCEKLPTVRDRVVDPTCHEVAADILSHTSLDILDIWTIAHKPKTTHCHTLDILDIAIQVIPVIHSVGTWPLYLFREFWCPPGGRCGCGSSI